MKKQREKRLAELQEEMRKVEKKCYEVREQILKAEFLLNENKKLFATSYGPFGDEEKVATPKELKQVPEPPVLSDKPIKQNAPGPVPRFMASTVASRQRQSASERDIVGRVKSSRPETRSLVRFAVSQSFSYSEPPFRAVISDKLSKKSRYVEPKTVLQTDSPKCNKGPSDLKPHLHPQSKTVTSSDPNMRVTLSHHRRRASSLI